MQERLRHANLLNEATAPLGASLELDTVLNAVVGAAGRLFESTCVVLVPSDSLHRDSVGLPAVFGSQTSDSPTIVQELSTLARRYVGTDRSPSDRGPQFFTDLLPSRRSATVLVLSLPTRHT